MKIMGVGSRGRVPIHAPAPRYRGVSTRCLRKIRILPPSGRIEIPLPSEKIDLRTTVAKLGRTHDAEHVDDYLEFGLFGQRLDRDPCDFLSVLFFQCRHELLQER